MTTVVALEFAAVVGQDGDGAVLVQDDVVAVLELDQAQVVVADDAVVLGLDLRLLEDLRAPCRRCGTSAW